MAWVLLWLALTCVTTEAATYLQTIGPAPIRFQSQFGSRLEALSALPPLLMEDAKPEEVEVVPDMPPPAVPILEPVNDVMMEPLSPEESNPDEDADAGKQETATKEKLEPIVTTPRPREPEPPMAPQKRSALLTPQMLLQFFDTQTKTNATGGTSTKTLAIPMFLPPLGRP